MKKEKKTQTINILNGNEDSTRDATDIERIAVWTTP